MVSVKEQADCKEIVLPKYVIAFDILNIIACISVIALHVNNAFWTFSYERYWVTSNLIQCVFFFAVPIFLMLSGATLMDYRDRQTTKSYFKKRFLRAGIPFLVWSVIAILWYALRGDTWFFENSHAITVLKPLDVIFNSGAQSVYWYFIPLFSVYLAIPVLSAIPKDRRKNIFGYAILVAFFTESIIPLFCDLTGINMNRNLNMPVLYSFLFLAVVGYYITRYPISKKIRIIIYILGVIGLALHFFGTLILSYKVGYIDKTFKEYLNFPSVMYSVAIFTWFFYHDWNFLLQRPKAVKFIKLISSCSFGVYLVHMFVIDVAFKIFSIETTSILWRTLGVPAIYVCALLAVLIIKKIPIVKNIVG